METSRNSSGPLSRSPAASTSLDPTQELGLLRLELGLSDVLMLRTCDHVRGENPDYIPMAGLSTIAGVVVVAPAAMKEIRAKVTDPPPRTMLGLGVGAIWLAVMFVAIFAPV